jgi:hypothetical protein
VRIGSESLPKTSFHCLRVLGITAPFAFSLVASCFLRMYVRSSSGPRMRFTLPLPLSNRFGLSAIGKPDFCMARTRLPTTGFSVTGARGIQVTGGYSAGVPAVAGSSGDEHPIYVYAW